MRQYHGGTFEHLSEALDAADSIVRSQGLWELPMNNPTWVFLYSSINSLPDLFQITHFYIRNKKEV